MMDKTDFFTNPIVQTVFWSATTIGLYLVAKFFYKRFPYWWLTPLAVTPLLVMIVVISFQGDYAHYIGATQWLLAILGPVTVAFAIPIWQQRQTIRKHWPLLAIGIIVGSTASMLSAWGLATLLHLDDTMRLSLLPRSISTPFAMTVSDEIGGIPDLTAIFVVLTGVFGVALGEMIMKYMPLRSSLARGALLGMGAHGAGVARAHQIGQEEGSIAGLVMVMVGIVNVFIAPLIGWLFA
ncbi:LrgB family protein [Bartonella tamiae]|uniref:TIGR00659 family protein n=1 Tax=Bartonella tamiae Th239 TaxID=1094558 RepID=J0ZLT5_9HYPH|nr:LrgB family protein [Bartonella tamiae]EJF89388.1 TIGR00659 family protein [Bartonella tamiae Th239]EJF92747.1 TIGR00659 family protein [Bartonella tamiae Th307]